MNDPQMESLLRKAPTPAPPPTLLNQLLADVKVTAPRRIGIASPALWSLLGNWLPVAACLICGITILVAELRVAERLRREQEQLRTATAGVENLRRDNAEYQRLAGLPAEIERLRAEQTEARALTAEATRLRQGLEKLQQITLENQRLSRALNLPEDQALSREDTAGKESAHCFNNLQNIGQAMRMYAADNDGKLATDFLTITNELATPRLLVCPSDREHRPPNFETFAWKDYSEAYNSYEILATGISRVPSTANPADPVGVYARCRIHGHVVFLNGTVKRANPTWSLIQKDGRWIQERHENQAP